MYPFPDRLRWFLAGRYAHVVKAAEIHPGALRNPVLRARVDSLRTWNQVRAGVIFLLSLGIAGAIAAWVSRQLGAFSTAADAVDQLAAAASASSGFLSIIYVALTRLLGQLEVDIMALLPAQKSGKT